jgi:hypothetical protein
MHSKPMEESQGTFTTTETSPHECRRCGRGPVKCQTWESQCGGYEDYQYTCPACGYVWWVDGIDS